MQSKGTLDYKGKFGLGLYVRLKGDFTIGSRNSKLSSSIVEGIVLDPRSVHKGLGLRHFKWSGAYATPLSCQISEVSILGNSPPSL